MSLLSRLVNLFRLSALERDFDDELRFHVNERIEQNLRRGLTREQAEAEAFAALGSIDRAKAGMREARTAPWLNTRRLRVGERRYARIVLAVGSTAVAGILVIVLRPWALVPPDRVFELADGVTSPVPLTTPRPEYTVAAKRAKIQGAVHVQCVVAENGECTNVRVTRSLDPRFGLDEEAVRAVRTWRFRPGSLDGQPVPTRLVMELNFALR